MDFELKGTSTNVSNTDWLKIDNYLNTMTKEQLVDWIIAHMNDFEAISLIRNCDL
jgi:hypothetical protein